MPKGVRLDQGRRHKAERRQRTVVRLHLAKRSQSSQYKPPMSFNCGAVAAQTWVAAPCCVVLKVGSARSPLTSSQPAAIISSCAADCDGHVFPAGRKRIDDVLGANGKDILQLLAAGTPKILEEDDLFRAVYPVSPIPDTKAWGVVIDLSKQVLLPTR